jgi:hypothetical protein
MKRVMKKRIIQLMLCASIYTNASAQTPANCPPNTNAPIAEYCEHGHGISTNPDNLVNDDCPDLKNDFEWIAKHTPVGNLPDERFWMYYDDDQNPSCLSSAQSGSLSESRINRINGLHGGEALSSVQSGSLSESRIKRINGLHSGEAFSTVPLPSVKSASSVQICGSDKKYNSD